MKHIAIFFVKLYRKFISPLKPPCCRFTPTCSQYAVEAFTEWGFIRGLGLTLCRQIVESHGAEMKFLSEPGKGTEIKITF